MRCNVYIKTENINSHENSVLCVFVHVWTVSIGRRVQDPMAELVKIDPKHIGIGTYQVSVLGGFLGREGGRVQDQWNICWKLDKC